MTSRIQIRAERYSDAVTESVNATMHEWGLPDVARGPLDVSQLARLGELLHVEVSQWFPLLAAIG